MATGERHFHIGVVDAQQAVPQAEHQPVVPFGGRVTEVMEVTPTLLFAEFFSCRQFDQRVSAVHTQGLQVLKIAGQ